MLENLTSYNTKQAHIYIELLVTNPIGMVYSATGILDTGAPYTEFADDFLVYGGFLDTKNDQISLKPGLQTQKYGKIILPSVIICQHPIKGFEVCISHFESAWGIDALVGLDFFRRFRVTIDYSNGILLTSPIMTKMGRQPLG